MLRWPVLLLLGLAVVMAVLLRPCCSLQAGAGCGHCCITGASGSVAPMSGCCGATDETPEPDDRTADVQAQLECCCSHEEPPALPLRPQPHQGEQIVAPLPAQGWLPPRARLTQGPAPVRAPPDAAPSGEHNRLRWCILLI